MNSIEKLESKESSIIGDPSKDYTEGSTQGELQCLEALQGATGQNPCWQGEDEAPISWEQHLSSGGRRLNWTFQVPHHLFKPTCTTALLLLGFSQGWCVLKNRYGTSTGTVKAVLVA